MDNKEVKKCKKTLNILRIAATDKENLTTKVHKKKNQMNNTKLSVKKNKKNADLNNKNVIGNKTNINKTKIDLPIKSHHSISILEFDLHSDNPSEDYWQKIAESCKKALNSALKENIDLHDKVNELEYENNRLKAMLSEAKSLVEVLAEMVENDDTNVIDEEESVLNGKNDGSESECENMSFQSCK